MQTLTVGDCDKELARLVEMKKDVSPETKQLIMKKIDRLLEKRSRCEQSR